MHDYEKSKISRIPRYADGLMLVFLTGIFCLSFEKARDFREILVEEGKTDFLIWGVGLYFLFRMGVFLYMLTIGLYKTHNFRKEHRKNIKTKGGFAPKHVNILAFLYNLDRDILSITVHSYMDAAMAYTKNGTTATIVMLITDTARAGGKALLDESDIRAIVETYPAGQVEVLIVRQTSGKRTAFSQAFDALKQAKSGAQCRPEEVAFLFIDGDSEIPKEFRHNFIEEAVRPLSVKNKIGGVTFHNLARVHSRSWWQMAQFWFKFIQRDFVMRGSANVLTGRGSAVLGTLVLSHEFQALVTEDLINHNVKRDWNIFRDGPLWAPVRFVVLVLSLAIIYPKRVFYSRTGDDKSTIYYLFREGWKVVFNPDLYVICHEDIPWSIKWLPNIWFFQFPALAVRYCRNSLNNNPRLLKLGVERLGPTRYMMNWTDRYLFWTPLVGPMSTYFLMNAWGFDYLYVYISWILFSRSISTLTICRITGHKWSAFYPIVLYYMQTALVFVKLWALVSAISSWTRQDEYASNPDTPLEVLAFIMLLIMITWFVAIKTGTLWIHGFQEWVVIIKSLTQRSS